MKDRLKSYIEENREEIIDFLADIVEIPSLTGEEGLVVERVKQQMVKCGYDEVFTDSIGNVVGRIGDGKKVIVYDAHLDVVDVERSDWNTDPYKAVIKDGRMYGRGTVDDKGPFVAMFYAGKAIKDLGLEHDFTIYILGSISEEDCDGLATEAFIKEFGIKADYSVVSEVSELEIMRGHRGRATIEVEFTGRPVHASLHHQGVNPIELAAPFIQGVVELDKRLPADQELGAGDVVVTHIECKTASTNTVPSMCKIIIDRRTNTLDTQESVLAELRTLPNADKAEIRLAHYNALSYNGYEKDADEYYPGWVIDEDHPLIQCAVTAYTEMFNSSPKVNVWPFCTNANYTMGKAGIPTVGFGPGEEHLCHGPNEYINLDELLKTIQFFAHLPVVLSRDLD